MQTVLLYLYISAYLCIIAVVIYLSLFSFLETQTSETLISRSVVKNGCLFGFVIRDMLCSLRRVESVFKSLFLFYTLSLAWDL